MNFKGLQIASFSYFIEQMKQIWRNYEIRRPQQNCWVCNDDWRKDRIFAVAIQDTQNTQPRQQVLFLVVR